MTFAHVVDFLNIFPAAIHCTHTRCDEERDSIAHGAVVSNQLTCETRKLDCASGGHKTVLSEMVSLREATIAYE